MASIIAGTLLMLAAFKVIEYFWSSCQDVDGVIDQVRRHDAEIEELENKPYFGQ